MGFTLHSVLMELGAPCVTGYINESVDEVAIKDRHVTAYRSFKDTVANIYKYQSGITL